LKKAVKTTVSNIKKAENDTKVEAYVDEVKFGTEGWRDRYYRTKFFIRSTAQMAEMQQKIRQAYIEGLQWVFAYYYSGCVSWSWFYPFHYAPMA
jgi:5'-3' exoribonuclease 2